eukprot:scaffold4060_cov190-Amphora_coffeaeformis.AAC.20
MSCAWRGFPDSFFPPVVQQEELVPKVSLAHDDDGDKLQRMMQRHMLNVVSVEGRLDRHDFLGSGYHHHHHHRRSCGGSKYAPYLKLLGQALVATQPRGVRSMHWHVDEIPNVEAMAAFLQSSSRLESVTLTCRYDDYNNNNKEEEARRVNEKLVVLLEALSYNTSGRSIRTLHLMGASWENAVVAAGEEQQQQQQRQEGNANTLQTRLLSAIQRLDSLQKLSLSACSAQFNGILGQGLVGHPGIKSVELHGVPAQPGLLPSLRSCHIRINDGNTSSLSPFSGEGIRELDVESFLTFDTDGQDGISVMNSVLSKTLHLRSLKLTLFSDGNTELRKVISKLPLLEELQAREYSCNETDWLLDCRCLKSFACQRLSREGMTNLLTRHGSLESLTIHGPISEPDMLHLLQLLEHNTNVKKLCIGECALSAALMHPPILADSGCGFPNRNFRQPQHFVLLATAHTGIGDWSSWLFVGLLESDGESSHANKCDTRDYV